MQHTAIGSEAFFSSPQRHVKAFQLSIRDKIFAAFLCMSVLMGLLGWQAAQSVQKTGSLVAETFDKSLMSIDYARAAAADFEAMQAALTRSILPWNPEVRKELHRRMDTLADSLRDDLAIAAGRAQSPRAMRAAQDATQAAHAWDMLGKEFRWVRIAGLNSTALRQNSSSKSTC